MGFPFWSSELLLIAPALKLNNLLSKDGSFDLRPMGSIHAALFLLAAIWLAPLLEAVSPGFHNSKNVARALENLHLDESNRK